MPARRAAGHLTRPVAAMGPSMYEGGGARERSFHEVSGTKLHIVPFLIQNRLHKYLPTRLAEFSTHTSYASSAHPLAYGLLAFHRRRRKPLERFCG